MEEIYTVIGIKDNKGNKITKGYGSGMDMMPIQYTVETIKGVISDLHKAGMLNQELIVSSISSDEYDKTKEW